MMNNRVLCLVAWTFGFIAIAGSASAQKSQVGSGHSPNPVNAGLFSALETQNRTGSALLQMEAAASRRQQELLALMQADPAALLASAIPEDVRETLPVTVRNLVERHVRLQGEMEIAVEDGASSSRLVYGLRTAQGRLALHFTEQPSAELLTGTPVQVEGVQLGAEMALASGGATATTVYATGTTSTAPILPNTFGAQKTLVILVNFQDNSAQPWTTAAVQDMVFNAASNFWKESSFQQTWLAGDVAGWYTIPVSGTTCPTGSIQTYAQQAAQAAGYVLSNYQRFVYAFPQTSACGWMGYSYIGGLPSNSWLNGAMTQWVVNHELGHSLGLYHAHSVACGSVAYASSGCTQYEYGDYYDTMGNSTVNGYSMGYNSYQKERLGWIGNLAQPPVTTVTTSGTYTITPAETQDGSPKALKVLQSGTTGTSYYIEFRQALGVDRYLSLNAPGNSSVLNGVLVHAAGANSPNSSSLLNMNPTGPWGTAMALGVGQTYTDSAAGVTVSPVSVSSAGATVQVTLAAPPCVPASPVMSLSPGVTSGVAAGTAVSFTLTLTDRDSSSCGSASFNVGAVAPSGWTSALSASAVTLLPGGSAAVSLKITSPAGTANGSYPVGASAANAALSSLTAQASGTYVVSNPVVFTMSVATDAQSYDRSQTVGVKATVLAGTSPAAGIAVKVTVSKSDGSSVLLSGTTGSNGSVALSYKLKRVDPPGTWPVKASNASASASTTITIR